MDGADDGDHGAPLFWQVAAVLVEVGHVSWVPESVSQSEVAAGGWTCLIKLSAWILISKSLSAERTVEKRPSA